MSEHELRDLLHRVVPEGDDVDAGPLAVAGRRRRDRVRGAIAISAAAAVAAVVVPLAVVGGGDEADRTPPVTGPSTTETPALVDPTSTAIPDPGEAADVYPSKPCDESTMVFGGPVNRKHVTSVSLCQIFSGVPEPAFPLVPETLIDKRHWLDAAVDSDMTPMDCNVLSSSPQGLLFVHLDDGTTRVLDEGWCATVPVDGQQVVVRALYDAFIEGIDAQRTAPYSSPEPVDPSCPGGPSTAPVRPGRETLTGAAVVCDDRDLEEVLRLDEAQATLLASAWDVATRAPLGGNCPGPLGERRYVVAATERGDLVSLNPTCGGLAIVTPDDVWIAAITIDELVG